MVYVKDGTCHKVKIGVPESIILSSVMFSEGFDDLSKLCDDAPIVHTWGMVVKANNLREFMLSMAEKSDPEIREQVVSCVNQAVPTGLTSYAMLCHRGYYSDDSGNIMENMECPCPVCSGDSILKRLAEVAPDEAEGLVPNLDSDGDNISEFIAQVVINEV